jgi:iron complex outermembrane receptor protein
MSIYYTRLYKPILFLLFSFFCFQSFGQARITGQVKGSDGQPLQGASIQLEGMKGGTVTDNEGNYSINAATGRQTLIISFVGFTTQRVNVTVGEGNTTQDITLSNVGDLSTITVIGSRNVSRTRVETPVPVDIIPVSQVINDIGQVDLNQILTYIAPSFQSARQTISDGTDHLDPAQLRGLGTDQVLVLINGKRRHQSALVNVNGTVNRGQVSTDLSAIPATAIERVEILRDGASAQYGSDAIAGVINIVLKKRTGLLEASTSYGFHSSKYPKNFPLYTINKINDDPDVNISDGETFQGNVGYGFSLGKGYLGLNGEYITRKPTNRTGTFTGAIYPNVGGQNRDDSIMASRGLNRNSFDIRAGNSEMKGGSLFYNFGYPVGKAGGELYVFGGYSNKSGNSAGLYRYPRNIPDAGNAGKYGANALALYPNGFLPEILTDIMDVSSSLGFRSMLGMFHFDISNTYGRSTFDFGVENSVNYSQFATTSTPQTSFDAGGLKFWQNTTNLDISRKLDVLAGLNIATGLEYRIDAFGLKSGEEASVKNYDPAGNASPGSQVFPGFINTLGDVQTRNAKAIYVDVEQDFTNKFLVTGALRFENYSDFGSTVNFKFSSRYKFADAFIIRGSISSGFRAPSMQQRFYAKTNTLFVGNPLAPVQTATFTNDSEVAGLLGIPKLKEETSMNYAAGVTARPFRGFEVTVDAYQIDIDDRIILTNNFLGTNNAQIRTILNNAGANRANFFTNAIDTRATGIETVLSYNTTFMKKHSLRTILAMTFIENEVKKGANGRPNIKSSDILRNGGELNNYFNREDQSRMELANPNNKVSLTFNYKYSKLGAMLRFVRFGEVQYWDGSNSTDPFLPVSSMNAFTNTVETTDQTFDAKTVTDLSISYQFTSAVGFTIGANNLFDVYPDTQTHSGNVSSGRFIYSRRVQQMGFNGAYYFARLKLALPTNR